MARRRAGVAYSNPTVNLVTQQAHAYGHHVYQIERQGVIDDVNVKGPALPATSNTHDVTLLSKLQSVLVFPSACQAIARHFLVRL